LNQKELIVTRSGSETSSSTVTLRPIKSYHLNVSSSENVTCFQIVTKMRIELKYRIVTSGYNVTRQSIVSINGIESGW